ncbi:MAG: hypothetical protein LBG92_05065 [Prevotellaceae bacterium]|nr:hypothetical protein [Prevotellaceae bacterium]
MLYVITSMAYNAFSQNVFKLHDDVAYTGPLQTIVKDVMLNDTVPCSNYTLSIASTLSPIMQGVASVSGNYIVFTPSIFFTGGSVTVEYLVRCGTVTGKAALTVHMAKYNSPANIVDRDLQCHTGMPHGISFKVHEKFNTSKNQDTRGNSIRLDGFSMPLVGDINGDGKPEIIALGLRDNNNDGNGLSSYGRYIHIFDGQTGDRIWSIDIGPDGNTEWITSNVTKLNHKFNSQFQLRNDPRHNSPGHLAIADLNRDGKAEIVVVETGSDGRIYALTPQIDSNRKIIGFGVMWDKYGAVDGYKSDIGTGMDCKIYGAGIPYIADINGDGTPEVLVYNKIYDGLSGNKVCTLQTLNTFNTNPTASNIATYQNNYAYVGRQPVARHSDQYSPCMAIADVDGDGILDIIAGSKVYKMKNGAGGKPALDYIIQGPSSVTVKTGENGNINKTIYLSDGFTVVADIDMDGKLDIIVMNLIDWDWEDNQRFIIYVWDPVNNSTQAKAAMLLFEDGWEGHDFSYPFVGDINGFHDSFDKTQKMPELCFITGRLYTDGGKGKSSKRESSRVKPHPDAIKSDGFTVDGNGFVSNPRFNTDNDFQTTNGFILGWTWHADPVNINSTPLEERLKLSWTMEVVDRSHITGITMFDFDNDGAMDVCYKDEKSIRVISPSRQVYVPYDATVNNNNNVIRFKTPDMGTISYTGYEAPVIADVNMDGSADIVTMNFNNKGFNSYSYVYVWEYESGSPKWSPCPPVWNQPMYNPRMINEDLTVPAKTTPMLTAYKDGNGDTVYPYNTHWVQQPVVRDGATYTPVVRNPDADLYDMSVTLSANKKTAYVNLYIRNKGSATINANTPIMFYDGGTNPGYDYIRDKTLLKPLGTSHTVGVDIFPGESIIRMFIVNSTVLTPDFNDRLIWASVMDDGGNVFPSYGYTDCNLGNNYFSASACILKYDVISNGGTSICTQKNGAGSPLKLTALPVGAVKYRRTYQWYCNQVKIAGATDSTYMTSHEGVYTCYVTEGVCRGFSSSITLVQSMMEAKNDTVSVASYARLPVAVTKNDFIPVSCGVQSIIITDRTGNCTLSVSNDTVYYTPNTGFYGTDSLTYSLTADSLTTAKVYVVVNRQTAQTFIACPDADAKISFKKISGVTYNWYSSQNVLLSRSTDTLVLRKNGSGNETFWAEPVYRGNPLTPRIKVELLQSASCGGALDSTSCAVKGTPVFREDFGGNQPTDPRVSPTPLPAGSTEYSFLNANNLSRPNAYWLLKRNDYSNSAAWHTGFSDHTFPKDTSRGYMFMVDASTESKKLYEHAISGLCDGYSMFFSVWAASLVPLNIAGGQQHNPELRFELLDINGNLIAVFTTGAIPHDAAGQLKWRSYGFSLPVPAGHSGAVLKIYSNAAGSGRNDFVLDDVEIRLCVPAANISGAGDTLTVCTAGQVTLTGKYRDDGTFGAGLASHWEYSQTGNVFQPTDWSIVPNSIQTSGTDSIVNNFSLSSISSSNTGYYRFVAAAASNTGKNGCRATSKPVFLNVMSAFRPHDIRIHVEPDKGAVNLNAYLYLPASGYGVTWTPQLQSPTTQIVNSTTASINVSGWHFPVTHTYIYTVSTAQCGSSKAKAYVRTVKKSAFPVSDTVFICKDLPASQYVHLNRITGLEAKNGNWNFSITNSGNIFTNNITEINSGRHSGAKIFDARKAFVSAGSAYNYNGDPTRKKFEFEYGNASLRRKITLIVY